MGNLNDLISNLMEDDPGQNIYEYLDRGVPFSTRLTNAQKQKFHAVCTVFGKKPSPFLSEIAMSALNDIIASMTKEQSEDLYRYLSDGTDQDIVDYIIKS